MQPANRTRAGTGPRRGRQFLRTAMATVLPRRLFLVRGPTRSNAVCLTFDDGPHPQNTPQLLDALKEHAVSATFFVIGQQAERHPDLVRRLATDGHVVGHHSFSHSEPNQTSAQQLDDEVRRTRELLTSLVGEASCLFRPPKGKVTPAKLWRLWQARQTVVLWNVDPKDYACGESAKVQEWFLEHPLKGGDVVVMHDNHPHAARVLPALVEAARRVGLRFTTIPEWLR